MIAFQNCKSFKEGVEWLKKQMNNEDEWNELDGEGEFEWQAKFEEMKIPEINQWFLRECLRVEKNLVGMKVIKNFKITNLLSCRTVLWLLVI